MRGLPTKYLQAIVLTYPHCCVNTFPPYRATRTLCPTLFATTHYGCKDTSTYCIDIGPDFVIYMPNAFTPNGDGLNDLFVPNLMGIDPNSFEMWIFDRWGNNIWYSQVWGKGWDGKANGGKDIAQQDVYVWKIACKDFVGKPRTFVGHVSLIR